MARMTHFYLQKVHIWDAFKKNAPKNDTIWQRFRAEISHMRLIQARKLKLFEVCISGVLCIAYCIQATERTILKLASVTDYTIYFEEESPLESLLVK